MNFRIGDITNLAMLAALAGGVYWVYKNRDKFNITSDKNVAYMTADQIAKMIGGEKATITDVVPGINKYDPNAKEVAKVGGLPSPSAPYWYNKDGSKRTVPTGNMGTAFDYNHRLIQIIDKASQRAVLV